VIQIRIGAIWLGRPFSSVMLLPFFRRSCNTASKLFSAPENRCPSPPAACLRGGLLCYIEPSSIYLQTYAVFRGVPTKERAKGNAYFYRNHEGGRSGWSQASQSLNSGASIAKMQGRLVNSLLIFSRGCPECDPLTASSDVAPQYSVFIPAMCPSRQSSTAARSFHAYTRLQPTYGSGASFDQHRYSCR
jgi:hypothetical protein